MDSAQIFSKIDHTILAPTANWQEVDIVCQDAIKHKTASVCIPPSYVKRAFDAYGKDLNICTVIGFPLGYSTTEVKKFETEQAIKEGASEIDVVINIGDVKNKSYDKITDELSQLKKITGDKILKVIVEVCYLSPEEKKAICKCVTDSGADFIKTSTGFGTGGATIEDINIFKANIGVGVQIKASGGIRTKEDFVSYINLGCTRIGTSSAVKVLVDNTDGGAY